MEGKSYIIMGFFWPEKNMTSCLHKFFGTINVTDDGQFTGITDDEFGQAAIRGEVKIGHLEFIKKYFPESEKGAIEPIIYLLDQALDETEKIICGGWKGCYKVDDRIGQASCLIYPDSKD